MKAEKKTIEKLKEIIRKERKQLLLDQIVLWVIIGLDAASLILRIWGK